MGSIESKPQLSSPPAKGTERLKKPTPQKESISRTQKNTINTKNTLQDKRFVDIKNIFASKEFLAKKFALSDAWIAKITATYKKFDAQRVVLFLKKTPQYLDARYPKALFATALIQYATTVQGGELHPEDFGRYVNALQEEHIKMQKMYDTFALSKDPAFASFQTFKKSYKVGGQTIDQVSQGKSFSNDTYIFFQYLSSDLFQKNKESIIGGMSASHRQEFAACLQSNVRIAQVAKIEINTLISSPNTLPNTLQQPTQNPKNLNAINATFARDVDRVDGPKQIIESVDQQVFGTERLQTNDITMLLQSRQQHMTSEQWETFYTRFASYFPKDIAQKDIVQYFLGQPTSQQLSQILLSVFSRIVTKELQPITKNTLQQHVMKLYFEQVSSVFQAGGDIVQLDAAGVTYDKDGSIHMGYTTTHGIRGNIYIDATGKVSVTDMFGYAEGANQGASNHIIQKIEHQLVRNGNLPSMKQMIERASVQKNIIFDQRQSYISGDKNDIIDSDILTPHILTSQDEVARTALATDMGKALTLTHTTDALYKGVTYTQRVNQSQLEQDIFSKYIVGREQFIDTTLYPEYVALQSVRETLLQSPTRTIERWNSAFLRLITLYEQNPHTTKETFPFSIDAVPGKESIFQLLMRFCLNEQQFDIEKFENMVQTMSLESPLPGSIGNFYADHPIVFPTKSLFTLRYPELAYGEKNGEISTVLNQTKNDLNDLRLETDLMQKLG